ncbi:MAG: hypothetical protein AB1553_09385 [Nitrospirota bacterium]
MYATILPRFLSRFQRKLQPLSSVSLQHSTYFSLGVPVLQNINRGQNELDHRVLFGVSWAM